MRTLAAELRRAAAGTSLTDYQAKFEQVARELESEARQVERRPRLAS